MKGSPRERELEQRTRELEREVEQVKGALALANATMQERGFIMAELLMEVGVRTTCAKCSKPVFWILPRHASVAEMFNVDGSRHWPACKAAERPEFKCERTGA
jgi:hypothetical protein